MGAAGDTASRTRALRLRPSLRAWHKWFGLIAGPWLLLLAVTGSAIAFYDDLDTWLIPDWRSIPASEAPHTPAVGSAMAKAGDALPGFTPRFIDLPNKAGETIMTVASYTSTAGERVSIQAFSHPGTGELLGWRENGKLGVDPPHLMSTIYELHVDLALGEIGVWLIGLIALLWLIDHLPAIVLAVPRLRNAGSAFAIAIKSGKLRRLYDLHRAPGMWLLPFSLALAITGLGLSWSEETRAVANVFSPISDRLHYAMPDVERAPAIDADTALRHFSATVGTPVDSVTPLPDKGVYAMRSFDPRDPDDIGRLWTYIDNVDGSIVAQRHDTGDSASDMAFAWLYPIHSGRALREAGQAIVLLAGLVTASLSVSGYILWWRRLHRR